MAKDVKVGSLVLILAGSNDGDTATVERVDRNGRIKARITKGKDVNKVVLAIKGDYKVI